MNNSEIIISGNHLELTDALKNAVLSKCERLFNHEDRIQRLRVELGCDIISTSERELWAKGHIEINGKPMIVREVSDDLYKSIDIMVEKLDRKLRRRSRLIRVKRKTTKQIDLPAELPKVSA